ncbi:porin [Flavobacterium sp. NKUCC04_CG]|uniref:porin n=1 Tax=Flavobacterium sp. NKUCC04_CG TaxID=2842121 RepID=UPI001C5ADEE2|nr:porin [Flavobacterium sp. NKUCC04_CG]MBW3518630.1 OprO/OprP family phosphate-selective porin [Flavobacterium sp. NKUCC04_CG]
MKKFFFYMIIGFFPLIVLGQVDQMQKQTDLGNFIITDSAKSLIPVSKQSLLRDVDVIFNTRMAFNSSFTDGSHMVSKFNADQFRFEIKGKIHDRVYFRFRNRYTREQLPGDLDNISRSVDLAFIKVDLSPRTNISVGKLCADWGGYEFDLNPIDIITYNDIIEYADNFLVGAGISHTLADGKNSFSFQVLNSRTKSYEEQYGASAPPNITASKFPLAAVGNWRGSFFDGKFETTYSYSFFNEAKNTNMNYFALGNKYKAKNFVLYYDFQYRDEALDRLGIASDIVNSQYPYATQKTKYIANWLRAEYLVTPKINVLLTAMNATHSWNDNPDANASSKLSTSYGLIPMVEYMPFKDMNIRFYIAYTARKYDYTKYAETAFGVKDYTTGFLGIGFIAPLLVL